MHITCTDVIEDALILTKSSLAGEARVASKLLAFFGVPARSMAAADFVTSLSGAPQNGSKSRLVCTAEVFLGVVKALAANSQLEQAWRERIHSVFAYAQEDLNAFLELFHCMDAGRSASLGQAEPGGQWAVSDKPDSFCGPLSGISVAAAATDRSITCDAPASNTVAIISDGRKCAYLRAELKGVPVFLSTSDRIIDVEAELKDRSFEISRHFLSAVPAVLYVRWAFAATCWKASELGACVVIDDPLLKRRYGFVNFQDLLNLMVRHRFSSCIAFIPWNWRRSAAKVVRLFKENPERYSLSVHGCDHTAGEFGTRDPDLLAGKASTAAERMQRHQSRTGIHHDRIMVFPQGVFSDMAMKVLKHADFAAAVNTEVFSEGSKPPAITVSDVWDVAMMRYDGFPMFTRRYPSQGVENFAFDLTLGKPCLIVIHHDFCRDGYKHLTEFIDRLNRLKCKLAWRGLGDVVERSYRHRELIPGTVEVEMYGADLRLENGAKERKRFCVRRRESDPSAIKEIRVNLQPVPWKFSEGSVGFELHLDAGEATTISVRFHPFPARSPRGASPSIRLKTMLRRYLSEVRDNYVARIRFRS